MLAPDALEEDPSRSGRWRWSGDGLQSRGLGFIPAPSKLVLIEPDSQTLATCWRTQKIIKDK